MAENRWVNCVFFTPTSGVMGPARASSPPPPSPGRGGSMSNRNAGSRAYWGYGNFHIKVPISGWIFQSQKWKLIFWHGTKHSERSTAAVFSSLETRTPIHLILTICTIHSHWIQSFQWGENHPFRTGSPSLSRNPKENPIHFSLLGADIGNLGISPPKCLTCIHEILLMVQKSCTRDVWNPVNNGISYQPQLVQDFFHQQYHRLNQRIQWDRKLLTRNRPWTRSESRFLPCAHRRDLLGRKEVFISYGSRSKEVPKGVLNIFYTT